MKTERDPLPPPPAGYQGIWFSLGQENTYGPKYSGGLATYTAKHRPLAIYSPEAETTFFVYGGTLAPDQRHLLCMIGAYDHGGGTLHPPQLVHDKAGVDDPHDNPSLALDEFGHLWVFVSGRGTGRPGILYRGRAPYSIQSFECVSSMEFTYPQPWWVKGRGFLHMFTRYTGLRELYFSRSADGRDWGEAVKLAGIGGHYQISEARGDRIATAFERHPGGDCDLRTDLYYLETRDMGATWQTVNGRAADIPLTEPDNMALVRNYSAEKRLVYVKDLNFDHEGHPVILYVTSAHSHAGPEGDPRRWEIAHWDGSRWNFETITDSSHNYDMGSLYIEDRRWRLIAPTEPGPQHWGQGGEVAVWESPYPGKTWDKVRQVTTDSTHNHCFVRRPVNAHNDFYAFWCDGDPDMMSEVRLYYMDRDGRSVSEMPYAY